MATEKNPLLSFFDTPFETVPFNLIKPEHFLPALNVIIARARKVFKETILNSEEPDFQNTIIPIEKCYDEISKTGSILFNLNSAATSPEIQAITQKVSPKITRFMAQLMVDYTYFKRVEKVY
ncbi:MAG TPA: M3 family peptidase, partial [Prolixibacteraceae bacterium]|nr:M3 family peptidase [Prolixibacteraceae bacterium]